MLKLADKRQQRVKVYFGPDGNPNLFWNIKVKNATKDVNISGKMIHALNGASGLTVGCHLSNAVADAENRDAFGHDVKLVVVTKTRMVAVTRITGGLPSEGILYHHKLGKFVDLNDTKKSKAFIKNNPDFFEREFAFLAPRKRPPEKKGGHGRAAPGTEKSRSAVIPNGAMRRAVKAGLIAKPVAEQLARLSKRAA